MAALALPQSATVSLNEHLEKQKEKKVDVEYKDGMRLYLERCRTHLPQLLYP